MAAPTPLNSPAPEVGAYIRFSRRQWAALRPAIPLTVDETDLAQLRGANEQLSTAEVADIYMPVARLLNLHIDAVQHLHLAADQFLGRRAGRVPYVIGIAGSVAAGKSTTARILQTLLARWANHPRVDLVTTDGFLMPNRELESRGLLQRKGFPESYDQRALLRFLADVKAGRRAVTLPVYSHLTYDIVAGKTQVVDNPDVLILEGLNVLQAPRHGPNPTPVLVSDFFDFSIFLDAGEGDLQQWYVDRFLSFRATAFANPKAYFHKYAHLSDAEAEATARQIWSSINGPNLVQNILPTRERARLVLSKGRDHLVREVRLRKL